MNIPEIFLSRIRKKVNDKVVYQSAIRKSPNYIFSQKLNHILC